MNAKRWFLVAVIVSFVAVLTLVAAQSPSKKGAPPRLFTISGHITGLASPHHARVVTSATNKPSHAANTRDDGNYTLRSVTPGSYTVRPSRSGYTFSPSFRTVAVTDANRVDIDFEAHAVPKKAR